MPVELKIKVTKDVLERSKYCQSGKGKMVGENCAIALAIRDIFPKAYVNFYYISVNGDWGDDDIYLPDEASLFIKAFDSLPAIDRVVLPEIEFTITIPDEIIETIDIESLRPLLTNHPTLELL